MKDDVSVSGKLSHRPLLCPAMTWLLLFPHEAQPPTTSAQDTLSTPSPSHSYPLQTKLSQVRRTAITHVCIFHKISNLTSFFQCGSSSTKTQQKSTAMSDSDFETAVADSKKLTSKPSNEHLLELYGTPVMLLST
jgi:hypothetical protein